MQDLVILEWSYIPPDFFEVPLHLERDLYEMTIDGGKVEARINPAYYDNNPNLRDQLHELLNNRFLGAQLISHRPYTLSKSTVLKIRPDGSRDVSVFVELGALKSMGSVDIVVADRDGKVLSDTRKERIEAKSRLADLAEKYHENPVVQHLLRSHYQSVKDPDNELVHLYEIPDALQKGFRGIKRARTALGISKTAWRRLHSLANVEPLRQGRHRGQNIGMLRDATEQELQEARLISRTMIEKYLNWLEKEAAS